MSSSSSFLLKQPWPFCSETVLFRLVLKLILLQNNHCLQPNYCCSKFCFDSLAVSAVCLVCYRPFLPITNCFLLMSISQWGLGFWAKSISPSSPFCGATFGYGQCCNFLFLKKQKCCCLVKETPSEQCMYDMHIDMSVQACSGPNWTKSSCCLYWADLYRKNLMFFFKDTYLIISAVFFTNTFKSH